MIKILFCCHGNICRSPMAEFVMKDLVKKVGKEEEFFIASVATSREEIGNPVHYGTRNKLSEFGISTKGKYAVQMTKKDYNQYDYIIGMDNWNIQNIMRIIEKDPKKKVHKLLEFAGCSEEIADPWYTGDFDTSYEEILRGCKALLEQFL